MIIDLAAALVALALADPVSAQPPPSKPPGARTSAVDSRPAEPLAPPPWLQKLTAWLQVVSAHRPGQMDTPAMLMGSATDAELEAVRLDFIGLLDVHRRGRARRVPAERVSYKGVSFAMSDIPRVLGLADEEVPRSDGNRILRRAAILHGDVAMIVIPEMPAQAECSTPSGIVVKDGQPAGGLCSVAHWAQGRALLDAIKPDPGQDPVARLWYQATIAFMLERGDLANGERQIERGRLLFPNDPQLLFEHGYFHETFAAPSLQAAAQAGKEAIQRAAPRVVWNSTPLAAVHLKEAEALFGRALDLDPGLAEARLRHAVVLAGLGQHEAAALELGRIAVSAQSRIFRYYAELFLGNEEQALGKTDRARAHFTEAAALFPGAPSPRLALSALARRGGDRAGALAAIGHVFTLPAGERDRHEPWWVYNRWLQKTAQTRLSELYRALIDGERR
jgi:hypothetical protein